MPLFTAWSSIASHLQFECIQARYEGKTVPADLQSEIEALEPTADLFEDPGVATLYDRLTTLEPDPSFPWEQPDDLATIRRLRPDGPRRLAMPHSETELLNRFHGAWLGRCAGCALGKPVEQICLIQKSRLRLKDDLQRRGEWPLADYFTGIAREDDEHTLNPEDPAVRENIVCMPADDDIHYTLMGLHLLERHGAAVQWHQIAEAWNASLPFAAICTAEAQAITNYNLRNVRGPHGAPPSPFWTARHNNPYREWIGAQIRADGWAYAAAGHPERAAALAWQDAHWTHTANGIYGEMFMAAVIAAAFVEDDPATLVRIGLSEIPATCRLAAAISKALDWVQSCPDFEAFMEQLEADPEYADLHAVHTVNNALVCLMALFYGRMETTASICTAVMGGLDTDCNGATVGSIVGAAAGADAFSESLKAPLNDTIRPQMLGFQEVTMSELARRTLVVHRAISSTP